MVTLRIKQPGEVRVFDPAIASASAIVALVDAVSTPRGLVPGAPNLDLTAELAGGVVRVTLGGGADGERYLVTVRVGNADGETLAGEIDLAVIDGAWVMPDGGVPYVSVAAFVDRVGLDEVLRQTDLDGSGRIDRALVIKALSDAQAMVDANLAGKYQLPLASVPPLVEMLVCDLARLRLYPGGAPEGIADAAKSATRTLERIASGQMQLGVAAAEAPPPAATTSILISPGRRQYPDGLCDY